jgi:hypothetical protein
MSASFGGTLPRRYPQGASALAAWMQQSCTNISRQWIQQYAQAIDEAGVKTLPRLKKVLERNGRFLTAVGIETKDAADISKALRSASEESFEALLVDSGPKSLNVPSIVVSTGLNVGGNIRKKPAEDDTLRRQGELVIFNWLEDNVPSLLTDISAQYAHVLAEDHIVTVERLVAIVKEDETYLFTLLGSNNVLDVADIVLATKLHVGPLAQPKTKQAAVAASLKASGCTIA